MDSWRRRPQRVVSSSFHPPAADLSAFCSLWHQDIITHFILSSLRKDLLNISSSCWLDKLWNKWKEKRGLFLMKKPWKLSELLFSTATRSLLLKLLWPNKITFFFTFLNFHSPQFMLCLRFLLPLHLDFWYIPFYRSYSKFIRWRHWIVFFYWCIRSFNITYSLLIKSFHITQIY